MAAVCQFTLTCSHRPIFICFVCVRHLAVAVKYPHLRSKVQQMFSKKLLPVTLGNGHRPRATDPAKHSVFSFGSLPPENSQLSHAKVDCGPLHSQANSSAPRTSDNPVGLLQRLADVNSLSFFHRDGLQRFNSCSLPQSFEWRTQCVSVGQDDAPFDEILQLTDVPRPRMVYQCFHHICRNPLNMLVHAFRIESYKVPHERRNVSAPIA